TLYTPSLHDALPIYAEFTAEKPDQLHHGHRIDHTLLEEAIAVPQRDAGSHVQEGVEHVGARARQDGGFVHTRRRSDGERQLETPTPSARATSGTGSGPGRTGAA